MTSVAESEFVDPGSEADLTRHRSALELVRVWEAVKERIERAFAEVTAAEDMLIDHFDRDARGGAGNPRLRGRGMRISQRDVFFDDPARTLKKLRHDVWDRIIDQAGVRQFMSVRAAGELDRQIRDQLMPEITEETVRDFAASLRGQIGELHAEAVREVFEFLRPGARYSPHKTNHKNEWQLGLKVILSYWVETGWSDSHFHLDHSKYQMATALENVFRSLDGKGQIQKNYHSDLYQAIRECGEDGRFETEYFVGRCFRNRNLHLKFKRPDLVRRLNQIAGGKRLRGERA